MGTLNGRARGPYVEVWNGSVWASRSSVDPIVGGPAVLTGVACTSASTCTAAGFYSTGSNVHTVLVESGPSWTTGAPVEPKGATTSGFTGISCASTATCIAVGYDDNGTGQVNLAERLKGGRWKILPTPNPSGATTSYLQGVSCPGASACEAVGAFARNLKYPGVAGYTIEVQVFGFGHLYVPFRPPVSTTLRAFTATPFDIHSGLQACDPTTFVPKTDGNLLAQVSNAGAQQFVTALNPLM